MHRYIETLVKGQVTIGRSVAVLDRIAANGDYQVGMGDMAFSDEPADPTDVLHLHFAWSARPFLRHHGRRFRSAIRLYHFHGPWAAEALAQGQGPLNALVKWLYEEDVYRRQRRFVCTSTAFASRLRRTYGIKADRISVVTPGVDTHRFAPGDSVSAKRALGLPHDRFVFAAVRRLEPRMGLHIAIDAMVDLPEAYLVIAGTGSLDTALRKQVDDLGLGDRVRLVGRIPDETLPLLYQAADTTVVPSTSLEGFGMVVLESLACGTGVIASDVGGLPEALGPFTGDWSYDSARPTLLLEKMRQAMSRPLPGTDARTFAESRATDIAAREIEEVVLG